MKVKFNNKYFRWGLTAFLVIVAGILFYYFLFHSSNIANLFKVIIKILSPVVFGMVIAYLLTPVLNFIEQKMIIPLCNKMKIKDTIRRWKTVRMISILFTAFLFVAIIYTLVYMLVSQIVPSIQNIASNSDTYVTTVTNWANKTFIDEPETYNFLVKYVDKYFEELENWVKGFLPDTMGKVIKMVSTSLLNVFGVLWNFIIGFIISIYMLGSKEKFAAQAKKIVYAISETETANSVIRNFRFTHNTFIGFLSGKILDSLIIGILCFIVTSIMHTPYAALVSVIIGCTNIIPFFGPFLGAVPSAFLILIVDPTNPLNCLKFIIFILILQQIDGNIIGPRILGDSTGLSGFWVIFAITLFGGLFGVLGMIIGIPIFAVIYAGIRALVNTSLEKKNLPSNTKVFENLDYIDEEGFHVIEREEKSEKKIKNSNKNKKNQSAETENVQKTEENPSKENEE